MFLLWKWFHWYLNVPRSFFSTGSGVGGLINPPKTEEELEEEVQEGHDNYVRTHNAYFVGKKGAKKKSA